MPKIKAMLEKAQADLGGGMTARWEKGKVTIAFNNRRKQVIFYKDDGEFYHFRSVVLSPGATRDFSKVRLAQAILSRNRVVEVACFVLTSAGGVEARIDQRSATLQPEELAFYLSILAREADRFEQHLIGQDRH